MKKALLFFICLTIPFSCFCSYLTDTRGKLLRNPCNYFSYDTGHPETIHMIWNNDPIPEVLLTYDLLQRTSNSNEEVALKMRIKTQLLLYMDTLCHEVDTLEDQIKRNLIYLDSKPSKAEIDRVNSDINRYRNSIEAYVETIRHVGEFMDQALETKREAA